MTNQKQVLHLSDEMKVLLQLMIRGLNFTASLIKKMLKGEKV